MKVPANMKIQKDANGKMRFKVLDLFSGIGGFSLGLDRAGGFETVAFCEIEPYCQKVLAKHWPGVPIYDDVRTLTADTLARDGIGVDVICGGFPCQGISEAGLREGLQDARSGLWSEYARLIGEIRPKYVIVETSQSCLEMGWAELSATWPKSGMTRNGTAYRLSPLVPTTFENVSGSLPTPTAQGLRSLNRAGGSNAMRKWAKILPKIMPTQTAHDYRGGCKPERSLKMREQSARGLDLPSVLRLLFPESTGLVRPSWAEARMGFPIGWTDVTPSETPSSLRSPNSSEEP